MWIFPEEVVIVCILQDEEQEESDSSETQEEKTIIDSKNKKFSKSTTDLLDEPQTEPQCNKSSKMTNEEKPVKINVKEDKEPKVCGKPHAPLDKVSVKLGVCERILYMYIYSSTEITLYSWICFGGEAQKQTREIKEDTGKRIGGS